MRGRGEAASEEGAAADVGGAHESDEVSAASAEGSAPQEVAGEGEAVVQERVEEATGDGSGSAEIAGVNGAAAGGGGAAE